MARTRADLLLVARGMAASRSQARAAIEAGGVAANGVPIRKPSELVDESAVLDFAPAHPWASRAGLKLAHALDAFLIDPAGRVCLDIGASTGGFTDVLLARGAERVIAIDVGVGQMQPRLAAHPRVHMRERTDARSLTRENLPEAPTLVVCDASFISAAKVLAAPLSLAAPSADLVVLVKPQFEAGPGRVKSGVLEERTARRVAREAMAALNGLEGFRFVAAAESPILGGDGNLEVLAHYRRG
ncbi:MAG TPA: TlyA family RNA methyltransferase [Caulobacterales bacterium]|nr:TlyA family RNA methyltransferase [Caulobacterales bacterium]